MTEGADDADCWHCVTVEVVMEELAHNVGPMGKLVDPKSEIT